MEGSDCTRDVLGRMTFKCDSLTHQIRKTYSLEYVMCRMRKEEIDIPYACRYTLPMTSCSNAMFKIPSMWTTYDGFYRNIDAVCHAHTFDEKLQRIETGTVNILKTGELTMTRIAGLVKQVFNFQMKTMPYLQSIENGVQNTLKEISSLTAIISKLYNLTERVADRVDVIMVNLDDVSDRMGDLSHNVSVIGVVIENSSGKLDVMSGKLDGFEGKFEKVFDFLELCHPFIILFNKAFTILCYPPHLLLLFCMTWVWLYHIHNPLIKVFSILIFGTFETFTLNDFIRIPSYTVMVVFFLVLLVFTVLYRLLCIIYRRRQLKSDSMRLDQDYDRFRERIL